MPLALSLCLYTSNSLSERMMEARMWSVGVEQSATPPPVTATAFLCPGSSTPVLSITLQEAWLTSRSLSITWQSVSCRQMGSVFTRHSCQNAQSEAFHQSPSDMLLQSQLERVPYMCWIQCILCTCIVLFRHCLPSFIIPCIHCYL